MARSLEWSGYEVKFVKGTEAHNAKHGSAILPDALRWLWKDFPQPIKTPINTSDKHYLSTALIPGKDWELVSSGHRFTEGPAVNKAGEVFFTDIPNNRIMKYSEKDGKFTTFKAPSRKLSVPWNAHNAASSVWITYPLPRICGGSFTANDPPAICATFPVSGVRRKYAIAGS